MNQGQIQKFAQMSPEQLREVVARASGTPMGQIASRILQQKMSQPAAALGGTAPQAAPASMPAIARGGVPHRAGGGSMPQQQAQPSQQQMMQVIQQRLAMMPPQQRQAVIARIRMMAQQQAQRGAVLRWAERQAEAARERRRSSMGCGSC